MGGRAARRKAGRALDAAADLFEEFPPAREVFKVVRAVPTRFVQLDWATRVGGYPVERVCTCHGPSSEGKTVLAVGISGSFLELGHYVHAIDAERTTDRVWVRKLIGDLVEHRNFKALRPDCYEDAIDRTRLFAQKLIEGRAAGKIPEDTVGFQFVDSMRKLIPRNLLDEIMGDADGDSKLFNRQAMRQAQANAIWLDELVPLADKAGIGFFLIAREIEDVDADERTRKAGNAFKVSGGKALKFDSSFQIRVQRESYVTDTQDKRVVFGERHRCTVYKTKVGEKDDRGTVFYFHTSNGKLVPFGFDRARDVLELAVKFGVVRQASSSFSYDGKRVGIGENNAVKSLTEKPELLRDIEAATRAKFAEVEPEQAPRGDDEQPFDPETGEVLEVKDHPFKRARRLA